MPLTSESQQHQDGTSKLNKQDQDEKQAIDAAIHHMRAFTPTDPYILTIPQDVEPRYHHSYAYQARQWLHHTPFDYREHESTQYQTFIYHEPGSDMYMLHNSRPVEAAEVDGGDASLRAPGKEKGGTGANTPNVGQGPKKTYSLSAYKKKQTGATPDPSAEQREGKKLAVKGPVERVKADEEVLAAVESEEEGVTDERKDLKRKRSGDEVKETSRLGEDRREGGGGDGERATKRPKTSTPPPATTHGQDKAEQLEDASQQEQVVLSATPPVESLSPAKKPGQQTSLPPRLSPPPTDLEDAGLPPKLSPIQMPSLPSRISPTLPPNIAAALSTRTHNRSVSRSSDVSDHRSALKDTATRHLTPPPKSIPRNGFRANSSSPAVRSDAEERGRPTTSALSRSRTPQDDSDEIPVGKKAVQLKRQRDAATEKSKLLVKLKFKKGQREAVRRILRMRPNPVKTSASAKAKTESSADEGKVGRRKSSTSDARSRARRDTNAKGVAQKVGSTTTNNNANGVSTKDTEARVSPSERKRARPESSDDSSASPSKRRKAALDTIEVQKPSPSTPAPSDLLSPSSAQKHTSQSQHGQQLTPSTMRKDVLSAAMKREHSTDSRLNTPSAMSQPSPTTNGTHQQTSSEHGGSSNKLHPSNKTPRQQAWETEQKRLETLGRELKHAATAHLASLSLTHSDPNTPIMEQKLGAIKSVEALITYFLAFFCADEAASAADPPMAPPIRTWHSLQGFYGFVRRSCAPFPTLQGMVCWLGVIFNAHILRNAAREGAENSGEREARAALLRAANEAEERLDIDALQTSFPRSWVARMKGPMPFTGTLIEPGGTFEGPYKLPLGIQTALLIGARAGYVMLEEWVGSEGLMEVYALRLKL